MGEGSERAEPAPKPLPAEVRVSNDSTTAKCSEARLMKGVAGGKYELHEVIKVIFQQWCVWPVEHDPEFLLRTILHEFNKHCQSVMMITHLCVHY